LNKVFETDVMMELVSKKTLKPYKKWHFVGWSKLPKLEELEHTQKGDWLHVTFPWGEKKRYNTGANFENGVEQ
jgi:hypothetical protein